MGTVRGVCRTSVSVGVARRRRRGGARRGVAAAAAGEARRRVTRARPHQLQRLQHVWPPATSPERAVAMRRGGRAQRPRQAAVVEPRARRALRRARHAPPGGRRERHPILTTSPLSLLNYLLLGSAEVSKQHHRKKKKKLFRYHTRYRPALTTVVLPRGSRKTSPRLHEKAMCVWNAPGSSTLTRHPRTYGSGARPRRDSIFTCKTQNQKRQADRTGC